MELEKAINEYYRKKGSSVISIQKLGSGLVADGYKVEVRDGARNIKTLVCRRLRTLGMSRDYFADNVGYLLQQHELAGLHLNHVNSLDVVCFGDNTYPMSLHEATDVFHVLEFAEGDSYVDTISEIKHGFTREQEKIIQEIARYMKETHLIKPSGDHEKIQHLYWRHSQDFIGSEVFMDIMDVWPIDSMMTIEKRGLFIDRLYTLREKLRTSYDRCSLIHADLHPDNIRVNGEQIIVMDAARVAWGEPMDDVTSMLANYIYFGIKDNSAEYEKAYNCLFENYFSGDFSELDNNLSRLFLPVRLLILAHPIFFSKDSVEIKMKLVNLAQTILTDDNISIKEIWTSSEL